MTCPPAGRTDALPWGRASVTNQYSKQEPRNKTMCKNLSLVSTAAIAALLCSCATTSVKETWKSPEFPGTPVGKVAVIAVEDRGMVRQGFENRYMHEFKASGQEATVTYELFSLAEAKKDKDLALEKLRGVGADSVIIMRLVDSATYYREVRPTGERYAGVTTGYEPYGWYGYYSMAFMDMGTTWGSLSQKVLLDTTLFDLKTGKKLWSGVTQTTVKENTDRVGEMDPLVNKLVTAMRRDGVVR
jgi:hypothetical protein